MYFPIFIDLADKTIVVIGGGTIATRRIKTLLKFACKIRLVAPQISSQLQALVDNGALQYMPGTYQTDYLAGAFIVIGATNDRAVNHTVYQEATAANIPVNIIDKKEECSFFFPAIFENAQLCGGLISKGGQNHTLAKDSAARIRQLLDGGR